MNEWKFSFGFRFSGSRVQYEKDEPNVITNAKKAIVESFLLPRRVSFDDAVLKFESSGSTGHRKISVAASVDKIDNSVLIGISL